jgi:hypothetical protein
MAVIRSLVFENATKSPIEFILGMLVSDTELEHNFETRSLPPFDLARISKAGKPFGFTVNDIVVAAKLSAITRLHEKHSRKIGKVAGISAKNLRTFPPPYTYTNESATFFYLLEASDVSIDSLKKISDSIGHVKQRPYIFYGDRIYNEVIATTFSKELIQNEIGKAFGRYLLFTSNLRGSSEPLHIQGKRVENLFSIGVAGLEVLYVTSYDGKLTI